MHNEDTVCVCCFLDFRKIHMKIYFQSPCCHTQERKPGIGGKKLEKFSGFSSPLSWILKIAHAFALFVHVFAFGLFHRGKSKSVGANFAQQTKMEFKYKFKRTHVGLGFRLNSCENEKFSPLNNGILSHIFGIFQNEISNRNAAASKLNELALSHW